MNIRSLMLACSLALAANPVLASGGGEGCHAPQELKTAAASFSAQIGRIASQGKLTVVALGSSSTEGVGASSPAAAYPAQLQQLLAVTYAGTQVTILNKGIGGETAGKNLARFERDVLAYRPDLVIWQVGTNDSFQNVDPEAFKATVRDGAARLRAIGARLMLMEPQVFAGEDKVAAYGDMIRAVRGLGDELGVPVLRRHDIMRQWLDSGLFTTASMLGADGLHMTDASYRCLANVLADMLAVPSA